MAKLKIGRSASNDVVLQDTSVSRNHAEAEDIGGGLWRLSDAGSSAGTYIEDGGQWQQITSADIPADTRVRFGESEHKLADLVMIDPRTVAPKSASASKAGKASSGLAGRASKGADEVSREMKRSSGGSFGGKIGGGGGKGFLGDMSPNARLGVLGGVGAFVLIIIAAAVIGLTRGGGDSGRVTIERSTPKGGTGSRGMPTSGARAELGRRMLESCRQRAANAQQCECIMRGFSGRISESDARVILAGMKGGGKPPADIRKRMASAMISAGIECARKRGAGGGQGGGSSGGSGGGGKEN